MPLSPHRDNIPHGAQRPARDRAAAGACTPGVWKPGSFCALQLLSGEQLDAATPGIQQLLAKQLIKHPPMEDELGWLANFPDQKILLEVMTNRSVSALAKLSAHPALASLPDDKRDQLLSARGLLACGLLLHCLQSRHRVNFGVNRSAAAKKRLAVPYRAADLPSERSEFSQPDVALVYTHLAYYGDGLSRQDFKAAVQMLLTRGPSEQACHYSRWLEQGRASVAAGGLTTSFDSVDKVDPHNSQLLEAMWQHFSHNMEVVNYWLATCVLPLETKQYPSRLVATAWHLAQNPTGNVAGFSGTNDNHRLLPLQVQQVPLDDAPELEGTNGKMLAMLLQHAQYTTLHQPPHNTEAQVTSPVWQVLLAKALAAGVDAIIDCGALLAGVNLRSAAQHVLDYMPADRYRGVTFFSTAHNAWVILDTFGRLSSKGASHLQERETLVLFDDARCRGSDLKLRQQAVGLLTLADGMPKDKVMQAAGRLRQLGRGQTLVVTGLPDISSKIWGAARSKTRGSATATAAAEPDMHAVLTWVMHNTVKATLSGIMEAASQGMQFAATCGTSPERCVWPERLSVEDLYASSKVVEPLPKLLAGVADSYTAHQGLSGLHCHNSATKSTVAAGQQHATDVRSVQQRFSVLGQGHSVLAGHGADEECERELEQEEEEEQEQEVQVAAAQASSEGDWNWAKAFTATSPQQLLGSAAMTLPQVLQLLTSTAGVSDIDWCGSVWATHNFVHSISHSVASPGLSDYLRPVGALLLFPDSKLVLLLSEREADALQHQVWTSAHGGHHRMTFPFSQPNLLLSLSYLRLACHSNSAHNRGVNTAVGHSRGQPQQLLLLSALVPGGYTASNSRQPPAQLLHQLVSSLVSVQLFGGCVMYGSEAQRRLLHVMMKGKQEAAQELVGWRGKLHMLARSDLDRACADDEFN